MTTATTTHIPSRACRLRGCKQDACAQAHARYMKLYRLSRARTGTRRVPSEPAAQHVDTLAAAGWSHRQIAAAAQCSLRTIVSLTARDYPTIHGDIARRILQARPEIDYLPGRTYIPATGTIRRIQALHALGHTNITIAQAASANENALGRIVNHDQPLVTARIAQGVRRAYKQLSPLPGTDIRARNRAIRNGWAPPAAWDDAVIDDPNAHPDWTGHCGTDRGWWTHRAVGQTPCPRCVEAHDQWRAANAKLTQAERARVMGKARAQASGREAAIAEDARELFAQGYDRHQIADRLGVTLSHLDHSITRHAQRQDDEQAAA